MDQRFFTDEVKQVMRLAYTEAESLYHEYVCLEHIILALLSGRILEIERLGVAHEVLGAMGIISKNISLKIRKLLIPGPAMITPAVAPLTQQSKKVLRFAEEEMRGLKDTHIGTEHLLLGIIRLIEDEKEQERGIAHVVLSGLATINRAREEVIKARAQR